VDSATSHPLYAGPMITQTNGSMTASVEVLTAEVRTIMVGNRQVTMSVYKQLDWVKPSAIEPFGRVRSGEKFFDRYGDYAEYLAIVGRVKDGFTDAGVLGRAKLVKPVVRNSGESLEQFNERLDLYKAWEDLPLIVLAGLR
jgi:hypothetical protein